MTNAKSPVKAITFEWKEGLIHEAAQLPLTVHSWAEARAKLREWSRNAPKNGGYHKVGYRVEWENGQAYTNARYDLKHWEVPGERCDLAAYIRDYLMFLAGYAKPDHMEADRYAAYLERVKEHTSIARHMLETLSFED